MTALRLPLSQGLEAIIDGGDAHLSQFKWHVASRGTSVYAANNRQTPEGWRPVYLHREIMQPPPGMVVDHINGDGLDNRRANLRVVTQSTNILNQRRSVGVCRRGDAKWYAYVTVHGRQRSLGTHATECEARAARDAFDEAHDGA